MYVFLLTHAEAERVNPRHIFRPLSDVGCQQVDALANHFKVMAKKCLPDIASGRISLNMILSSPSARCIHTVLLFAAAINEFTGTSDIGIRDKLGEKPGGMLSKDDLVSVIEDATSEAILLCMHGDLAGALPNSAAIKPEYNDRGFFTIRPVLTIVRYGPGTNWDEAEVLYCESPTNDWEPLMRTSI